VHSGVRFASFATKVETLGAVNWEQGGLWGGVPAQTLLLCVCKINLMN